MAQFSDYQVRTAAANAIKATAAAGAVVFNWWALGYDGDAWPGLIRRVDGYIHGYVVTRTALRGINEVGGVRRHIWTYTILALYGYRTGNETDNSEKEFSAELTALADFFSSEAIQVPVYAPLADQVEILEFPIVDLVELGGELVHIAQGSITVTFC